MATPAELAEFAKAVADATAAQQYCFLWIDWWPLCMDKAAWASWAQAFFSVVAIGFAVEVPRRQHLRDVKRSRQEAIDADLTRTEALHVLVKGMRSAAELMKTQAETSAGLDKDCIDIGIVDMQGYERALGQIDCLRIQNATIVREVFRMTSVARMYVRFFETMHQTRGPHNYPLPEFLIFVEAWIAKVGITVDTLRGECDALKAKSG